MPNGRNGSWVTRLGERDASMKTLKTISAIVGIVIALSSLIGGPIVAYYKGKLETEAKFSSQRMALQEQHEELMLILIDIENKVEWTEASVEILAEKVPVAIRMHEYKMHPKEYHSPASPTKIEINLPKKPKKLSKAFRPANMKWVRPE